MSNPNALWDGLWARLDVGTTLALATQGLAGGGAVRMVVLRGADRETGSLTFYTHVGSGKVAELSANPMGEVLLWEAETQFQARLSVTIDCAPGSEELWKTVSPGGRANYVPSLKPGSAIDAPFVPKAAGPEAFVVLSAEITAADILDLSALPHKRAKFDAETGFTGLWVAP